MPKTPFAKDINDFSARHIGSNVADKKAMLARIDANSIEDLINEAVPPSIHLDAPTPVCEAHTEEQTKQKLLALAAKNKVNDCYIGLGFHPTLTPTVIQRNIFENPGWYTAYTPYQPEIAQGRLEALTNFQQMVMDLTAMPLANASLLDEATAAAEAMAMSQRLAKKNKSLTYLVDEHCHPNTLSVLRTRAEHFGFTIELTDVNQLPDQDYFGLYIQYPNTLGELFDLTNIIEQAHNKQALVTVGADLLSLCLLKAPGEMGADIVVGNSQRFGVPMGFGGPHAAFFACKENHKRTMPGRIIGVSKDAQGNQAYRMAMQTREQHIRREKATSNICTSQALLAVMASFYAVYHGPDGLKAIAQAVHVKTYYLKAALEGTGLTLVNQSAFDTLTVTSDKAEAYYQSALEKGINLRLVNEVTLSISLHETITESQFNKLLSVFDVALPTDTDASLIPSTLKRTSAFLTHPVFNQYHSETECLRYIKRLENKDVSLTKSMIPLGSCTMKLNATTQMQALSWAEFSNLHPFAPKEQTEGYYELFAELEEMLKAVTGYDAISLQPNAGSQGEYAGLLAIKGYLESIGEGHRDLCLIPQSAHGTNPASAAMAGMKVIIIACDAEGNVDVKDLKAKLEQHAGHIACLMVTYPSTHGVFETQIGEICQLIHDAGGQVYIDGANMNALVGIAAPGKFGADVSHLNLHKTFAIPHGGGGPGMGPIGVRSHLADFLPNNPIESNSKPAISGTPFGSASILTISWAYMTLLGTEGLKQSTESAILHANYMAERLSEKYQVLYRGDKGRVAHECIIDIRPIKEASGISEEDIAKRLIDFGFHAPTMSFPVAGTLMIEPTESESKAEIDRFCDSLLAIYDEILLVQNGNLPQDDNPLVNAPHTHQYLLSEDFSRVYSAQQAAYPLPFVKQDKYWPPIGRVDNVYGDRNLFCACPAIEDYE